MDNPTKELDIRLRLGLRVRALREARDVSRTELAHAVGVDRSYLADIENGVTSAGIAVIERLADGLGVTLEQLFSDDAFRGLGAHGNAIIYQGGFPEDAQALDYLEIPDPEALVLGVLRADDGNTTIARISEVTGLSQSKVHSTLTSLRESGTIDRVGSRKTGRWVLLGDAR